MRSSEPDTLIIERIQIGMKSEPAIMPNKGIIKGNTASLGLLALPKFAGSESEVRGIGARTSGCGD